MDLLDDVVQEDIEREEEEEEGRDAKRLHIEEGKVSELYEEEEKEQQEVKKIRIGEGPGRHKGESKLIPKRIETGIFCHVPPELLYHILKFLSSEVPTLYLNLFTCGSCFCWPSL